MTTVLVLVILALIWGFVLVPPYLQNRREARPGDSIASFRQQLYVLERTTPGSRARNAGRRELARPEAPLYGPSSHRHQPRPAGSSLGMRPASAAALRRAEARRRRRDIFLTLLGAVCVTLLLAVALGGTVWVLHLLIDAAFVAYVGMLVKLQQESAEKSTKVRYLQPMPGTPRRSVDHPLLLRRSGS